MKKKKKQTGRRKKEGKEGGKRSSPVRVKRGPLSPTTGRKKEGARWSRGREVAIVDAERGEGEGTPPAISGGNDHHVGEKRRGPTISTNEGGEYHHGRKKKSL